MTTLLVPIDFSKSSEYATKTAVKIAKKTKATIYLIHLIELPTGVIDFGSSSKFSIPESMLYLRKVREKILNFIKIYVPDGVKVEYFIKLGSPFEGIKKYAQKINADLIVMGSKGHSELEELIIGSNTEKVVRYSTTPVIVVKKESNKIAFKQLVFASNFKKENKIAFEKFLKFASFFNSKIHLLTINTPSEFISTKMAKTKIKSFIKEYKLDNYTIKIYNEATVEKGIINYAKSAKADLIGLATHGRSGISHLFTNSVTKNLSKKALKPLFTVKV